MPPPDLRATAPSRVEVPPVPKVLVADDEASIADTLALILKKNGFVTTVVYDGKAALRTAKSWRPDILICDIVMPGLNGYTVARRVRMLFPECVIFLLSAQLHPSDRVDDGGPQPLNFEILTKPIHPDDLILRLRSGVRDRFPELTPW
jgi:DNA-binding response OmpR family regulator